MGFRQDQVPPLGLSGAYQNASTAAQNVISANSTLGPPTIVDGAIPLANGAFVVQNNAGTIILLAIGDATTSGLSSSGPYAFGTTMQQFLFLANTTPTTAGIPAQYSPDITLLGGTWDGSAPHSVEADLQLKSVTTGTTAYTADLDILLGRHGGYAAVPTMRLTWDGTSHKATFNNGSIQTPSATALTAVAGAALGTTGQSVTMGTGANVHAGTITFVPGSVAGSGNALFTITMPGTVAAANGWSIRLWGGNSNAGTLLNGAVTNQSWWITSTTTSWTVNVGTAANGGGLTAGTSFVVNYQAWPY